MPTQKYADPEVKIVSKFFISDIQKVMLYYNLTDGMKMTLPKINFLQKS